MALHATLVSLRPHAGDHREARDATPELTVVKHQLRDWIELHLSGLQWKDGRWTINPSVLEEQLNDELQLAISG